MRRLSRFEISPLAERDIRAARRRCGTVTTPRGLVMCGVTGGLAAHKEHSAECHQPPYEGAVGDWVRCRP